MTNLKAKVRVAVVEVRKDIVIQRRKVKKKEKVMKWSKEERYPQKPQNPRRSQDYWKNCKKNYKKE